MNKQRKVVITTTYNEMGIIIDTKAEEVAQPNLQPTCNQLATDTISRQAAIDAVRDRMGKGETNIGDTFIECFEMILNALPSAQPEDKCGECDAWNQYKNYPRRSQWIPCSERLPEYDGEMYLVTDYCEQINRRRIHVSYCYVNREGFWSDVPLGYKVLAWMPLPEPYKEKDNERA